MLQVSELPEENGPLQEGPTLGQRLEALQMRTQPVSRLLQCGMIKPLRAAQWCLTIMQWVFFCCWIGTSFDVCEYQAFGRDLLVQEQMDVDGAAQPGPLKAGSMAVLLGQALQAQDRALLEKYAMLACIHASL